MQFCSCGKKLCHNLPRVCNVAKISLLLRALTRHFLTFDCSPFKQFCINVYHTEYQLERRGKKLKLRYL